MLDLEVMFALASTATSLGVVIFFLNRFRQAADHRDRSDEPTGD